jgi:PTS system nitrogen regulatory IIA component
MKLVEFIREDLVLPDLRSRRKSEVIRELAAHLADAEGVDAGNVEKVLLDRENLGSTALAEGIAIPHAKLDSIGHLAGCIGRSRKGIDFGSDDGSKTHLFFVLIAPQSSTGDHLKALARISRLFRDTSVRERLMAAETAAEIYAIIKSEDNGSAR